MASQPRGALPHRNGTNSRNVAPPSGSRQNGQVYADPRTDPRRFQRPPPLEEDEDDDDEDDESSDEEDDSDDGHNNAPQGSRIALQSRSNTSPFYAESQNQAQRQISAQQQIYTQQPQRSSTSQQRIPSDQQSRYTSSGSTQPARRTSGNVAYTNVASASSGSSGRAGDPQSRYTTSVSTQSASRESGIVMPANVAPSSARPPGRDGAAQPTKSRMAWSGNDLQETEIVTMLTRSDEEEIAMALARFKKSGFERNTISTKTFPLSKGLSQKLADISKLIHNGLGVAVIRGLGRFTYSPKDSATVFAGVCAHICSERAQHGGFALDHVFDASHLTSSGKAGQPGSRTADQLDFHADRFAGDVLAIFVQDPGDQGHGGEQYVASFETIYNDIAARAPNILNVLAHSNWPFELEDTVVNEPVVFPYDGRILCQLVRAPLLGTANKQRRIDSPALDQAQMTALELVHRVARANQFKLPCQRGDIQLVNNLGILHARSSFERRAGQGQSSRHLLRMFLRDPKLAWRKPPSYEKKFNKPFAKSSSARSGDDMLPAMPIFNFDEPTKAPWPMEMHG